MKAIILIHGFCTNIEDFKPIIPHLEKIYDHVEKYIVPGHTIPPKYSLFKQKVTFQSLLDTYDRLEEEYDEIDCMGFSMGGALATYLQSVRDIHRLVLLAPANRFLNFNLLNERVKYKIDSYSKLIKNRKEHEEIYKGVEAKLQNLSDDDKEAIKIGLKDLLPHYTIHNVSVFISIINRCNKELINLSPKTLIVWGKLDQLVPKAAIDYLASIATNECRIIVHDNLSHLMLRSSLANDIIKDVIKFLEEEE